MSRSRPLAALTVAVVSLVWILAAGTAALAQSEPLVVLSPTKVEVDSTKVDVTMRDGVVIKGTLSVPKGAAPATGWPLALMPGTFGGTAVDSTWAGATLAKRGYVVYAYYERGFGGSGGVVEGGSQKDIDDVKDLLTWALATTPADPDRVGLIGLSYGAGIAMMAGMQDTRVKGVSALTSWADMVESFYPNRTPNTLSLQGLYADAVVFGKPSPELTAAYQAMDRGDYAPGVEFARTRGALQQYAARTNTPALMINEGVNEVVFPILGTVEFFEKYEGRKRLNLRAGDHGTPEGLTSFQLTTPSWIEGFRWLDNTVAGYDTSMLAEPQVYVYPRSSSGTRPVETRSTTANPKSTRLYLASQKRGLFERDAGVLAPVVSTRSTTLKQGSDIIVRNGFPLLTYGVETYIGIPPLIALDFTDPNVVGIWRSAVIGKKTVKLRGEVRPHLQLTPSARTGTVVVHVLDVDPFGVTYAVAHHPYSWTDATPGKPFVADFAIPYNAYDLPAGHRLVVTVSTSDTTYTMRNPVGSTVTVGPQSWVDVPVK